MKARASVSDWRTIRCWLAAATLTAALSVCGCDRENAASKENPLIDFLTTHVRTVQPLEKEAALAWWQAATTGKPDAYEAVNALTLQIRRIYTDANDFAYLKGLRESGMVQDSLRARQVEVLYYAYLENQIDPGLLKQIVDMGTKIEQNFSTHRGRIDGRTVTDNEIKEILKTDPNSAARQKAWLASKQVGPVVAEDILTLVRLRNQAARSLGFDNYHTLALTVSEQDVAEVDAVFAELERLTDDPFAAAKGELDAILARSYGMDVADLMPWHYHDPFFQETPLVYELDLDRYYADADIKALAARFYAGIGLPVESILDDSDLYDREGKNPHAFSTDIDRAGDVRILCNIKPNETWMETVLHELGHGVYDFYRDPEVPYLLRRPAHAFTTEGIAMFFGRLSRNAYWMQKMLGLSDEQRMEIEKVAGRYARLKQLIFARWAMVMYHFEKALYADPDQDLNALWWEMVTKYQLVRTPPDRDAPDWAAKIHFAVAPCYYHNYMLGELFASQLHHHIVRNVLMLESDAGLSYVDQPQAGAYLKSAVFRVGAVYHWNEMIRRATGEHLTAGYFVEQFVD